MPYYHIDDFNFDESVEYILIFQQMRVPLQQLLLKKYNKLYPFINIFDKRKINRKKVDKLFEEFDFILTPTTGTIYKISEVNDNPIELNTNLGYYTNFMNLLDLSAIALPAGFRKNGLPFGVTIIADNFEEEKLLDISNRYLKA